MHQKQGDRRGQTMPIIKTHAKGVPPLYLTPTEVGALRPRPKNAKRTQSHPRGTPILRNEPNLRIPGVPPTPISAKRTQSTPPADLWKTNKCETNPIPVYHVARNPLFRKTNPISAAADRGRTQIMRNETRQIERMPKACILWLTRTFSAGCAPPPSPSPFMRNEPNFRRAGRNTKD